MKTKQTLFILKHFNSKTNAAKALKLTRPTVDKICSDPNVYIKYSKLIADTTGVKITTVLKSLNNGI